ncbi:hypothetical protein AAFF_G00256420 [Aldrovandia affinis]|uniref:Uncharacterized protein n=1 Tax=Aldrovandia affinis TaxID=143900 RepID=A0AAD7SU51_9TELE|nr:hypothetical protein AAFF_G00256420 [Aldrovandia affinis]
MGNRPRSPTGKPEEAHRTAGSHRGRAARHRSSSGRLRVSGEERQRVFSKPHKQMSSSQSQGEQRPHTGGARVREAETNETGRSPGGNARQGTTTASSPPDRWVTRAVTETLRSITLPSLRLITHSHPPPGRNPTYYITVLF